MSIYVDVYSVFILQPPIQVFGMGGRYATALYSAAMKEKKLEVIEKELKSVEVRGQCQRGQSWRVVSIRSWLRLDYVLQLQIWMSVQIYTGPQAKDQWFKHWACKPVHSVQSRDSATQFPHFIIMAQFPNAFKNCHVISSRPIRMDTVSGVYECIIKSTILFWFILIAGNYEEECYIVELRRQSSHQKTRQNQ